ncbi:unnamed protein product [Arabis nemorensis]|uniref:Uncharacterized protein n=1 Tax=Arabis nemorensis TaxID=586526 RepID=A0A565B3D5_9BRAS|nr:unnamed protein product [Arabis nemorensis]
MFFEIGEGDGNTAVVGRTLPLANTSIYTRERDVVRTRIIDVGSQQWRGRWTHHYFSTGLRHIKSECIGDDAFAGRFDRFGGGSGGGGGLDRNKSIISGGGLTRVPGADGEARNNRISHAKAMNEETDDVGENLG